MKASSTANRPSLLVLARHGESAYNRVRGAHRHYPDTHAAQIVTRTPEHLLPLTARGKKQARALGPFLRDTFGCFDKCYDSGYLRAVETRKLALAAGYAAEEVERMHPRSELLLREREYGLLRNLTAKATRHVPMYDLLQQQLLENPFQTRPIGGESIADVADRLRQFRALLIEHHAGKKVVVFCHSIVMKAMRILLMRQDVEEAIETSRSTIANTGVYAYRPSSAGWVMKLYDPSIYERSVEVP